MARSLITTGISPTWIYHSAELLQCPLLIMRGRTYKAWHHDILMHWQKWKWKKMDTVTWGLQGHCSQTVVRNYLWGWRRNRVERYSTTVVLWVDTGFSVLNGSHPFSLAAARDVWGLFGLQIERHSSPLFQSTFTLSINEE